MFLLLALCLRFSMVGAKPLIIESTRLPLSTDGKTLNTTVLQSAIDRIAHHRQGGTLILHKGIYLTGMLHMRSNVELHLMPEAVLLGSTSPYDYDEPGSAAQVGEKSRTALLVASGQHNISITGKGVIDGQGLELALTIDSLHHIGERIDPNYNQRRMRPNARPKLFFFDRCDGITVKGITARSSAEWGISIDRSSHISIDSIQVVNRAYWNNDGIDLTDCRQARITHCDINAADDGVCLKSEYAELCCDSIYIAHCRIASSASAVKFGTASYGGFRHIEVRDIEVYDTFRSAIAIETVDGGIIDDILVDGIRARNTGNPIFVCLGARHDEWPGICRNIIIRNVDAEVPFGRPDEAYDLRGPEVDYFHNPWPSSICGLPGRYIENVVLENIRVSHPGRASKAMAYVGTYRLHEVNEAAASYPEFTMYGELPAWAFYVRHVRGITLRNIKAEVRDKDFRPAFIFDDVEGKTEEGVWPPTNL